MFLGFVLAATSLAGSMTNNSTAIAILAAVVALGIPIMDTLFAMVRRTLARQSIFSADRGHIHHKLLELGLTTRHVALMLCGLSLAFAAVAIAFGRSWHIGAALTLLGGVVFVFVRALRRAHRRKFGLSSMPAPRLPFLRLRGTQSRPRPARRCASPQHSSPRARTDSVVSAQAVSRAA